MKNLKILSILIIAFSVSCTASLPTLGMSTTLYPSPSPPPADSTATSTLTTGVCKVTVGNLNLRREPGTNAAVDAVLNSGDILTIDKDTPAQESWQRVFYGDLAGWINMNYCK